MNEKEAPSEKLLVKVATTTTFNYPAHNASGIIYEFALKSQKERKGRRKS